MNTLSQFVPIGFACAGALLLGPSRPFDNCRCEPTIQMTAGNPCNVTWVILSSQSHDCMLMNGNIPCIQDPESEPCNAEVGFLFPCAGPWSPPDGWSLDEVGGPGLVKRGWTNGVPDPTINVALQPSTPLGCGGGFGYTFDLKSIPGAILCTSYVGVVCSDCLTTYPL